MSEYVVTGGLERINFGATGVAEVLQNVAFVLATPIFSCPLDREFAWNQGLDAPINVAQARMGAHIVEAIQRHEPRAQVVSVSFQSDGLNGLLKPVVRVRITDGEV